MRNTNGKTYKMVMTAMLSAIVIMMAFTPLGYLKAGVIEISFLMIPVAIGAVACGKPVGTILGLLFGITSFIQCFGMSALGVFFMSVNPLFCFIICVVARLFAGMIADGTAKLTKPLGIPGFAITGLAAALANTVLFVGSVILFFWNNDAFIGKMAEFGISTENVFLFVAAFAGVNALIEAVVTAVITGAVGAALDKSGLLRKNDSVKAAE